jgi:hypothetical protein
MSALAGFGSVRDVISDDNDHPFIDQQDPITSISVNRSVKEVILVIEEPEADTRERNVINPKIPPSTEGHHQQHDHPHLAQITTRTQTMPSSSSSSDRTQNTTSLTSTLPPTLTPPKATLFVHVGPPKTGTKTLQVMLTAWEGILMEKDNILYTGLRVMPDQGRRSGPAIGDLLRNFQCFVSAFNADRANKTLPGCFTYSVQKFEEEYHKSMGQDGVPTSFIQSSEFLTENRKLLWNLIGYEFFQRHVEQYYNLKIISTYRRLEDWYPSARHQVVLRTQNKRWKAEIPPIFPQVLDLARTETHWAYPTPSEFIQRVWQFNRMDDKKQSNLTLLVHNMHLDKDSFDMFETFVCTILQAENTCQFIQQQRRQEETHGNSAVDMNFFKNLKMNDSPDKKINLLYDEIASAAAARNIINKDKIKRRPAWLKLRAFHEETLNQTIKDLPMQCPSHDQLEEYLNISITVERKIVPEFAASPEVEEEHRAGFWKSADSGKYCSVNVTAVLEDATWRKFFQSMT